MFPQFAMRPSGCFMTMACEQPDKIAKPKKDADRANDHLILFRS
jgi:hypothetical protein